MPVLLNRNYYIYQENYTFEFKSKTQEKIQFTCSLQFLCSHMNFYYFLHKN